jgi:hypothetical protein
MYYGSPSMHEYISRWWHRHLEDFTLTFVADLVKTILVLFGLSTFYCFIRGMGLMGYATARLDMLEEVHFWASYAAMVVLGLLFVGRLVLSPFKGK